MQKIQKEKKIDLPKEDSQAGVFALVLFTNILGFILIGVITGLIGIGAGIFGATLSLSVLIPIFSALSILAFIFSPGIFGANEH